MSGHPRYALAEKMTTFCRVVRYSFTCPSGHTEIREEMMQLNAHASSRFPIELNTYSLNATLLRWHRESDEDFHLVLSDTAGRTLIAEIPAPDCVSDTHFAKALTQMRARLQNLKVPSSITIRGVAFLDFKHGQDGVAPNAIELHPVLGFRVPAE